MGSWVNYSPSGGVLVPQVQAGKGREDYLQDSGSFSFMSPGGLVKTQIAGHHPQFLIHGT